MQGMNRAIDVSTQEQIWSLIWSLVDLVSGEFAFGITKSRLQPCSEGCHNFGKLSPYQREWGAF